MKLDQLIRFAFASKRRKLMTLVLLGGAGVSALVGGSSDKPAPAKSSTSTTVQAGEVSSTSSSVPHGDTSTTVTTEAVHYASCEEVRAAGKAPLQASDPGYRKGLDRNGDGQACE